jgi:uncharacterized protein YjdB
MTYPTAPIKATVVMKVEVLAVNEGQVNVRVTTVKGEKIESWLKQGGYITYDLVDVPGDYVGELTEAKRQLDRIYKLPVPNA